MTGSMTVLTDSESTQTRETVTASERWPFSFGRCEASTGDVAACRRRVVGWA
jgi:hypothetical protein